MRPLSGDGEEAHTFRVACRCERLLAEIAGLEPTEPKFTSRHSSRVVLRRRRVLVQHVVLADVISPRPVAYWDHNSIDPIEPLAAEVRGLQPTRNHEAQKKCKNAPQSHPKLAKQSPRIRAELFRDSAKDDRRQRAADGLCSSSCDSEEDPSLLAFDRSLEFIRSVLGSKHGLVCRLDCSGALFGAIGSLSSRNSFFFKGALAIDQHAITGMSAEKKRRTDDENGPENESRSDPHKSNKEKSTCIHCEITLRIGESCAHTRRVDKSSVECLECDHIFASKDYSLTNHKNACWIFCVQCRAKLYTAQPNGCVHATRYNNIIKCHICGLLFSPAKTYTYKRKLLNHARHECAAACRLPTAHGTRNAALLPVPCFRHVLCVTGRCRCSSAPSPAGWPCGKRIYCVALESSLLFNRPVRPIRYSDHDRLTIGQHYRAGHDSGTGLRMRTAIRPFN